MLRTLLLQYVTVVTDISATTTLQAQVTNANGLHSNSIAIPTRNNLSSLALLFMVSNRRFNKLDIALFEATLGRMAIVLCPKEIPHKSVAN